MTCIKMTFWKCPFAEKNPTSHDGDRFPDLNIDNMDQILSKIVFWKLSSSYSGIHVVKFYETYVWVFMKPGAIFSIFEVFQSILQPSGISDWK